jgi:ABC-type antimicrobial peptide transport system permease subunit
VIGEALSAAVLLAFLSVVLPARKLKRLDVAAILAGRT